MTDERAEELLRRAVAKTSRGMGCVGIGAALLGGFMIALHAAGLDPDARTMPLAGVVALYFFAILFLMVGVLVLYVGLVKFPRQTSKLVRTVLTEPARVVRVYRKTIKTEGYENLPGGQHSVFVELDDGTVMQLAAGATTQLADEVYKLLAARAPHALTR
jgi:hypothetical protein